PTTGNIVDQCAIMARGGAPSALEPVAYYANYLRGLKDSDGTPKEVEIGAVVSLQDGTQDPGICANPTCDAACDAPAAVSACDTRCKTSPTYQICMADCAAECHTFCGGQVPGRRYLELAYAFSGVGANVCSDDASPSLSQLSAVIGIPKRVLLRAPPSSPELLLVRVERGGQTLECAAGQGYQIVTTSDGPAVQFEGNCLLQPDDTWPAIQQGIGAEPQRQRRRPRGNRKGQSNADGDREHSTHPFPPRSPESAMPLPRRRFPWRVPRSASGCPW